MAEKFAVAKTEARRLLIESREERSEIGGPGGDFLHGATLHFTEAVANGWKPRGVQTEAVPKEWEVGARLEQKAIQSGGVARCERLPRIRTTAHHRRQNG